jgi:hypothetical protein
VNLGVNRIKIVVVLRAHISPVEQRYENSKSETIEHFKNSQIPNPNFETRNTPFENLRSFEHQSLLRVSTFGFRASDLHLSSCRTLGFC